MEFAVKGFRDAKLTLTSSATCFVNLCHDCSDVLSPFTEQFIAQILVPEFIATWTYSDSFRDIMSGFGYLIDKVSTMWPFIDRLLTEFVNEDSVIEAICRLMKHGMRSLSDQFSPYLQPLIRKALLGF